MAPSRAGANRRNQSTKEPEDYHELGVAGRKTGILLRQGTARDEYGMERLSDVFSSPEKASSRYSDDEEDDPDDDQDDSGMPMDLDHTGGVGPQALFNGAGRVSFPIPRARSPKRLGSTSPPRRLPLSSPIRLSSLEDGEEGINTATGARGGISPKRASSASPPRPPSSSSRSSSMDVEANGHGSAGVRRKLDFARTGANSVRALSHPPPVILRPGGVGSLVYGNSSQHRKGRRGRKEASSSDDSGSDVALVSRVNGNGQEDHADPDRDDSLALPGGDDDSDDISAVQPAIAKRRGPGARTANDRVTSKAKHKDFTPAGPVIENETPSQQLVQARKRVRSAKTTEADTAEPPNKRRPLRHSLSQASIQEAEAEAEPCPAPRRHNSGPKSRLAGQTAAVVPVVHEAGESSAQGATASAQAKRGRLEMATSAAGADESVLAATTKVSRGPPLPKARGLVSQRAVPNMVSQTRSGRHSFKPLAYWRNERVDYDREAVEADDALDPRKAKKMWLPAIKEVIRVDEEAAPPAKKKSASRKKNKNKARLASPSSDQEESEVEQWEHHPGIVNGDVYVWEPEHEINPPGPDDPIDVRIERIAIARDAINTKQIKDATFRFAKLLSEPYLGAGVVDLPPGSIKRPKNSRKMHMCFFVHKGKVKVTVHETVFTIRNGGTFFVPRANYYSIENCFDKEARVFFTQACEAPASGGTAASGPFALE